MLQRERERNALAFIFQHGALAAHFERAMKHLLLPGRGGGGGLVDLRVDFLEQTRHGRDHRRANLFDVFTHGFDAARETDLDAEVEKDVEHHALEDMRERQESERDIVFARLNRIT